jgi:hypothetical protein
MDNVADLHKSSKILEKENLKTLISFVLTQ